MTTTAPYEPRRLTGATRRTDVVSALGAAMAAVALTSVIFTQVAPFDGVLGFVVLWFVLFVACYGALVSLDERRPTVRDRLAAVLVHGLAVLVLAGLVVVVLFTFYRGREALL